MAAVVFDEFALFILLSMSLMTSLNALLVVDVFLNVVVPFFSAEVVLKDVAVEQFTSANRC